MIMIKNIIMINRVRISSFDKYEGLYRNYILQSPFSLVPVADILPTDIQKYYNDLIETANSSIELLSKSPIV